MFCPVDCVGKISGLPANTVRHGDVAILQLTRYAKLELSCRCPSHNPLWHILTIVDNDSQFVNSPVGCEDNGKPCGGAQTYIPPENMSPGKFTFLNRSVQANQTTLLQCFNRFFSEGQRDSVILLVKGEDNNYSNNVRSQESANKLIKCCQPTRFNMKSKNVTSIQKKCC